MTKTPYEGREHDFFVTVGGLHGTVGGLLDDDILGVSENEMDIIPETSYTCLADLEERHMVLYHDVHVRDIIAWFEGGQCKFCDVGYGEPRRIFPDVEGDRTEDGFDLSVEEGAPIACPVCLGVDIAERHAHYHQYWSPSTEQMEEELEERERELDYYKE
ncbi:hypothetical protein GE09DRAFT_1129186 [Coniochaeta sp. 2T2.1]|nr:hypothetical protein GE09DRAFT_1129186 [Coniochaeta sp. 2T2.1]